MNLTSCRSRLFSLWSIYIRLESGGTVSVASTRDTWLTAKHCGKGAVVLSEKPKLLCDDIYIFALHCTVQHELLFGHIVFLNKCVFYIYGCVTCLHLQLLFHFITSVMCNYWCDKYMEGSAPHRKGIYLQLPSPRRILYSNIFFFFNCR